MEKTWKPTVAGILSIIAGVIGLIMVMEPAAGLPWWTSIFAFPLMAPMVVPIVGGIYALRRRRWGLALAGSILALIGLGILALLVILVILVIPILPLDAPDISLANLHFGIPLALGTFAILGILPLALLIVAKREFR